MHRGPRAVIEPGARKAEVGPPSVGEPDRLGIEGDRALEICGPKVHVVQMNRHVRLPMPPSHLTADRRRPPRADVQAIPYLPSRTARRSPRRVLVEKTLDHRQKSNWRAQNAR